MVGVLLSFPRSGNHLVRFLIEFITARPTNGCLGSPEDPPLSKNVYKDNPRVLEHVSGFPQWWKYHWPEKIIYDVHYKRLATPDALILIARDPREAISKHVFHQWNEGRVQHYIGKWLESVEYFRGFQGRKYLLRYEELVSPFTREQTIRDLSSFVGGRSDHLERLISDLPDHLETCRRGKGRSWRGSESRADFGYHLTRMDCPEAFEAQIVKSIPDWCGLLDKLAECGAPG